jgi:hypothetical protein
MTMRSFPISILAASLIALAASPAFAADPLAPRFFIGGGATGTPTYGYQGGWNVGAGVELPVSKAAHWMFRADYQAVPFGETQVLFRGASSSFALGDGGVSVPHATLISLATGLRLSASSKPVQTYADALVGVGHLDAPPGPEVLTMFAPTPMASSRDETNVMLSFGGGVRFLSVHGYGLFADVHYDYYYVEGANTPVVPIRFGLSLP